MDIVFKDERLRDELYDPKSRQRRWGPANAKAIARRLDNLKAAPTLAALAAIPQAGCHELKGDRQGQLAVRAAGGWRIVIEPAHEPVPVKADGGLDRTKVTAVRIIEVVDYHE